MNSRQKQAYLDALKREKAVLEQLEKEYRAASKECSDKIAALNARTDLQNLQSIIYQKKYQEMLKGQIDSALKDLHDNSYREICDFLENQYSTGFTGALYDMQGQGVPLTIPFNHDAVIKAIENDSKLSKPMYDALGENITTLKSAVRSEVSRGIALGKSWVDVAQGISKSMVSSPFNTAANNSMRIARTEGQRVLNQARFDSQMQAKAMGADVVKQWDSTLDGRTRPWHRECDGQIREMEEDFDVGGERMKAPCIGGSAKNVINCRCTLLQRARWALDEPFTKADSFSGEIREFKSPADYATFKQNYWSTENVAYMKYVFDLQVRHGTKNMQTLLDAMTDREYKHYHELLDANPFYKKKKATWKTMQAEVNDIDAKLKQKQAEVIDAEAAIRNKKLYEGFMGEDYRKYDGMTRDDLIKRRDELQVKVDKAEQRFKNFVTPDYPEQPRRRDFFRDISYDDPDYDAKSEAAWARYTEAKKAYEKAMNDFNKALEERTALSNEYYELDRQLREVKSGIRNWSNVEQYRKYMSDGEAAERIIDKLHEDVERLKTTKKQLEGSFDDLLESAIEEYNNNINTLQDEYKRVKTEKQQFKDITDEGYKKASKRLDELEKDMLKLQDEREELQKHTKRANLSLLKKQDSHDKAASFESDLRGVNPNYKKDGKSYTQNCQRCVPTWEMRRRGYDVEARPRDWQNDVSKSDSVYHQWRNVFEDAHWIGNLGNRNTTVQKNIEKLVTDWGDGARGEIFVAWKGGSAHVFGVENVGGTVRFIDGQTNSSDVAWYFKQSMPTRTEIARIDNLKPSKLIFECCKNVGD